MTEELRFISATPVLTSLDIERSAALHAQPWATREFAVLDPDGNLVTFAQWNEA